MKRNIILLTISLLLFITLIPSSIYADTATTTPDVTVYATKKQMMDGTFAPNADGTADIKARIQFGKDEYGADYRWFILKADEGVKGDNTIIFSMDFIAKERLFNSSSQEKIIYDYTNDDTTVYSKIDSDNDGKVTVSGNHYGASDLRKDLIAMASNESMFSPAEQELMNSTPIQTEDANNNLYYKTNDKLYAMSSGDSYMSNKVKLGSSDQLTISTKSYTSYYPTRHGWLRTPYRGEAPGDGGQVYYLECLGTTRPGPYNSTISPGVLVIPASNLNLTDVLFASAAKAGSNDIIESNTAMSLRLNGKNKNIGEVYYDEVAEEIIVSKGTTESKAHLIVQGKGSTPYYKQNWYYSKEITETETIKASDIKQALGLSSDPSLANSKIWLEITGDDGMIYATEGKKVEEINNIDINIKAPEAGKELAIDVSSITESVNVDSISWTPNDTVSGYNKQYTVTLTLSPELGYRFTDNITLKLNNKDLSPNNTDSTITVTYTFDETAKDVLDSIDNPEFIYENGTPKEEFIFPDTVAITTKGNSSLSVPVTWDKDVLNTYNPLNPDEVMIKLSGTASIPEYIDYTSNKVIMTITVESKIRMIDGDKQTANINKDLPAVFKSNAEFKDFVRVEVDDEIIVKDQDYEVREGSIIVTLKPEYLSKLSLGKHKIAIISYKDKNHEEVYEVKAEGTFTIISNKAESGNNGSHAVIIPDTSVR